MTRKAHKRAFSALLAVLMVLTLMPVAALAASPGYYLDYNAGTFSPKPIPDNATKIDSTFTDTLLWDDGANGGWYYVTGIVNHSGSFTVDGDVHLVLMDNCNMTVTYSSGLPGINVAAGNSLTIYAEANGGGATGKLAANGDFGCAGIGSYSGDSGTITINGGDITATGGNSGAGIGGGHNGHGGTITINGGKVTATGGAIAAGIGGGYGGDGGTITITGGNVTANGGSGGAGIGGGNSGAGGTILITGGTVTAIGGEGDFVSATGFIYLNGSGAGIGSGGGGFISLGDSIYSPGDSMSSGQITISGSALVTATGGDGGGDTSNNKYHAGAGIGSGGAADTGRGGNANVEDNEITIETPGNVTATGGAGNGANDGADVGKGGEKFYTISGKITDYDTGAGLAATLQLQTGWAVNIGSTITADANGDYTFTNIIADSYQIYVTMAGYADGVIGEIGVAYHDETDRDCWLTKLPPVYIPPTPPPPAGFDDVHEDDWFYDDVTFVDKNGIMDGTSNNPRLFSPHAPLTRGMLATILWRMEGSPDASALDNPFDDVAAGMYYTDGVKWAAANGIVKGYGDGTFLPEKNITREELATMLYRYVQFNGGGFEGAWMFLPDFVDMDTVSDWAYEAVCWCTVNGVIYGRPGKLFDPSGTATRAEAAAMLHRLITIPKQ